MSHMRRSIVVLGASLLMAAVCLGQATPSKKGYTLHGRIEAVNESAKSITVNGEKVEGLMGAMTMDYKVDDPTILDKLRRGDRIPPATSCRVDERTLIP